MKTFTEWAEDNKLFLELGNIEQSKQQLAAWLKQPQVLQSLQAAGGDPLQSDGFQAWLMKQPREFHQELVNQARQAVPQQATVRRSATIASTPPPQQQSSRPTARIDLGQPDHGGFGV